MFNKHKFYLFILLTCLEIFEGFYENNKRHGEDFLSKKDGKNGKNSGNWVNWSLSTWSSEIEKVVF